jgi:hypothetical protein
MRKSIEVVDGFYRDPVIRRELALDSEWVVPDGVSVFDKWTRDAFPDPEATARIAALLGRDSDAAFPTLVGRFTFVGDGEGSGGQRAAPHVHDEQWAVLVYLAPPEGGFSSGVEFHRPASAASTPGSWGSSGVHEVQHPDLWEETMYVPLTFNRMVLFQGSIAHRCAGRGFGRAPADGRVAQLFLFDEPDGGGSRVE